MTIQYRKLNAAGIKEWGNVFPTGVVPVLDFLEHTAALQGQEGKHKMVMIPFDVLDKEQYQKILDKVREQHQVTTFELDLYWRSLGYIPHQAKWLEEEK